MLFGLCAASGIGYVVVKTYQKRKKNHLTQLHMVKDMKLTSRQGSSMHSRLNSSRKSKPLISYLSQTEETPWTVYAKEIARKKKTRFSFRSHHALRRFSSQTANGKASWHQFLKKQKSLYLFFQKEILNVYQQDTRHQQLQEISTASDVVASKGTKKTAKKNLTIASINLALATGGALFYPPLYLSCIFFTIYPLLYIYKDACRALFSERRISADALIAVLITGAMAGGFFFITALGLWYGVLIRWLLAKTEGRAKKGLIDLFGEQPQFVWVVVDGSEIEIPFETLQKDDIVVVVAGQTIPIDGPIIAGSASVDQHKLTGEAQPVEVAVGESVFASTMVLSGMLHVRVEKTGQETVVAQIGEILNHTSDFELSIRSRVESFHDKMVPAILMLSSITLPWLGLNSALSILWNYPGHRMLVFAPMNMLNFLHISSHRGILIKDGRALENLGEVDTIIFDKTGTLTLEQPYVSQIYRCNGLTEDELLKYAAAAEYRQSHPFAAAILTAANRRQLTVPEIDHTHVEIGYGVKVHLADKVIRVGSERFMAMEGITIPDEIKALQVQCHTNGYSLVMVAMNDSVRGAIELRPTIRREAKEVVRGLQESRKTIYIISGDHEEPTRQLAQELGIKHYIANTLPQNKAAIVRQLQQDGRTVCFVGDGINDAIALKQADVSISLRGATTIATDTAQIILMDENLAQLTHLFEMAQEFKTTMNTTFMGVVIPNLICIGGTFFLHWGFMANVMIGVFLWFPQLAYVLLPLHKYQAANRKNETEEGSNKVHNKTRDSDGQKEGLSFP